MDGDHAKLPLDDALPDARVVPAGTVEQPPPPGIDLFGGQDAVETARELLHEVIDPEIGLDIVTLGLVYDLVVDDGTAIVTYSLTTPGCPMEQHITGGICGALQQVVGVETVVPRLVWDPAWNPGMIQEGAW